MKFLLIFFSIFLINPILNTLSFTYSLANNTEKTVFDLKNGTYYYFQIPVSLYDFVEFKTLLNRNYSTYSLNFYYQEIGTLSEVKNEILVYPPYTIDDQNYTLVFYHNVSSVDILYMKLLIIPKMNVSHISVTITINSATLNNSYNSKKVIIIIIILFICLIVIGIICYLCSKKKKNPSQNEYATTQEQNQFVQSQDGLIQPSVQDNMTDLDPVYIPPMNNHIN